MNATLPSWTDLRIDSAAYVDGHFTDAYEARRREGGAALDLGVRMAPAGSTSVLVVRVYIPEDVPEALALIITAERAARAARIRASLAPRRGVAL